jgi:hypothetical protein
MITDDEKRFYLMLCGWQQISGLFNELWWTKTDHSCTSLDNAYQIERKNNGCINR